MSDEGKLFIGGLSFETNEDSLAAAFGKYGTIEKVDVIRDKETGRSRGFGFVKYCNSEDAKDAMAAMDGKSLDGRSIRVDEAGKGSRRPSGGQYAGRGGGRFGGGGGRGRGGYDRGYGDRGYDRGCSGGDRGDRGYSGYRSGSGGGGGGGSGGYSGSYRDTGMNQRGYDRRSNFTDYDQGYAPHE